MVEIAYRLQKPRLLLRSRPVFRERSSAQSTGLRAELTLHLEWIVAGRAESGRGDLLTAESNQKSAVKK